MRSFLLALALLAPLAAQAQIYKWTDEQGRPRYGERPPPGVKARLLAPPAGGAPAAAPRRPDVSERLEKGERVYSDAEREAQAARLRALIRERCS